MPKIASLENLYLAYHKACRGKQRKHEVRTFAAHFDDNIHAMQRELMDGSISLGDYRYFTIHDPKERIICAAPFRERILQHAVMNVCHAYFDRKLIDTTYATRKGKGVYAALEKAVEAMSRYEYTVKLDIRKYYDSIEHDVLRQVLRQIFKDKQLLALFDKIIGSYCVTNGRGLPIGNLTSQYFANAYLSALDHKAKEEWGAPLYIRYMDDIFIAGNDKAALRQCVRQMERYAADFLQVQFKPPIYRRSKDGQLFLGYRVLPFHCKLSGRSKKRFRSKLLNYGRLLAEDRWTEEQYAEHILPLLSFARHAESRSFRAACLGQQGGSRGAGLTA
ncbi:MAG: reverse transcriptase domain-containing protein [Bacteroidaceae bacterium]